VVNQIASKVWRKVREWRVRLTIISVALTIIASLCTLYAFFHQPAKEAAEPSGWQFTYQKTVDGLSVSIVPIPGGARILPSQSFDKADLQPHQSMVSPVPLPKSKPKMWERNYAVWVPDGDIGDRPNDPDRMRLKKEWRSCDLPDRHPICSQSESVRRDAKPLFGY
jgi:hypothetical protein